MIAGRNMKDVKKKVEMVRHGGIHAAASQEKYKKIYTWVSSS
jgi:hypothetical protein